MIKSAMSDNSPAKIEKVAIIGAGAMGLMLAALIGSTVPTVVVCIDPARTARLQRAGARVRGKRSAHASVEFVDSITALKDCGPIDAVFIATKTTAIPAVAAELKPALPLINDTPGGAAVISFQNGIEPGQQLIALLDHTRMLRMVLAAGATLQPDEDEVHMSLNAPPHAVGVLDPKNEPIARALAALLTACGFETVFADDIETRVWAKGIINAAANPVAAIINSTVRDVMTSPARLVVQKLLQEGLDVARAEGRHLGDVFIEKTVEFLTMAGDHIPSMVEDIRLGRESEVGQLNRQIIHHGTRLGVETPTHLMINALIEAFDWQVYARQQKREARPRPG